MMKKQARLDKKTTYISPEVRAKAQKLQSQVIQRRGKLYKGHGHYNGGRNRKDKKMSENTPETTETTVEKSVETEATPDRREEYRTPEPAQVEKTTVTTEKSE